MGATHPLGNTEEALIRTNYGVAERDAGSTVPFNQVTGVGHVDAHVGLYDDCIRRKNTFLLIISEIFGGVNGRAIRFLTRLVGLRTTCAHGPPVVAEGSRKSGRRVDK